MVTIHRAGSFRVVVYTNDHQPSHVHVLSGSGEAKINLVGPDGAPELVSADGMSRAEVRRAMALVGQRQIEFLQRWRDIHG